MTERNVRMIMADGTDVVEATSEELAKAPGDKPLFLFVNFMDAHAPYFPPEETYRLADEKPLLDFYSDYRTRYVPPWETLVKDEQELAALRHRAGQAYAPYLCAVDLGKEHLARYRSRYEACIRHLDTQLGRLFAILEERKLLESSIVVITADHGEAFGEDGFIGHGFHDKYAYEATHHVPLLILPPQRLEDGPRRVEDRVRINDILPTIHAMIGISYDVSALRYGGDNSYGSSLTNYMPGTIRDAGTSPQTAITLTIPGTPTGAEEPADDEFSERLRAVGYID